MKPRSRTRAVFRYPVEFKERAVALSKLPGLRVREVAQILMIHPQLLVAWRSEAREGPIKGAPPSRRNADSAPVTKARAERAAQEASRADDALRRLLAATPLLQHLSAMRNGAFASLQDATVAPRNVVSHPSSQDDAPGVSLRVELVSTHFGMHDNGRAKRPW